MRLNCFFFNNCESNFCPFGFTFAISLMNIVPPLHDSKIPGVTTSFSSVPNNCCAASLRLKLSSFKNVKRFDFRALSE